LRAQFHRLGHQAQIVHIAPRCRHLDKGHGMTRIGIAPCLKRRHIRRSGIQRGQPCGGLIRQFRWIL